MWKSNGCNVLAVKQYSHLEILHENTLINWALSPYFGILLATDRVNALFCRHIWIFRIVKVQFRHEGCWRGSWNIESLLLNFGSPWSIVFKVFYQERIKQIPILLNFINFNIKIHQIFYTFVHLDWRYLFKH